VVPVADPDDLADEAVRAEREETAEARAGVEMN